MTSTAYPPNDHPGRASVVVLRRTINDEIARMGSPLQATVTGGFEFVCECGDRRCKAIVRMTLANYAQTTPGSVVGHD
jgi:hypothetical protein